MKFQVKRGKDHYMHGKHSANYVSVVGQRFGKLLVVEQPPGIGTRCICDCGNERIEKTAVKLRSGNLKSCGKCTGRIVNRFSVQEDEIILRWSGIKTNDEIAEMITALGRRVAHRGTIANRLRNINKNRAEKVCARPIGEISSSCTVSDEDVEMCRQLYEHGLRVGVIAEKMELKVSFVSSVVSYRRRLNPTKGI